VRIPLTADMVRIVDPPPGDRSNAGEAAKTVDKDRSTGWDTEGFNSPKFGNLKPGMGVLINLGSLRNVAYVRMETNAPGVSVEIRTGATDPGDSSNGDKKIVETYKKLGQTEVTDGFVKVLDSFDDNTKYQYVLVWLTQLPKGDDGRYRISVTDIEVFGN
jgi:hypothetical protein